MVVSPEMGISVVALLISFLVLYKNHLQDANIQTYLGDSIGIVRHTHNNGNSVQLACVFANLGAKVGAINRLSLKIFDAQNRCYHFGWKQFIKHTDGINVSGQEGVRAIPVLGKDVCFQRIQFSSGKFDWKNGTYKLVLNGWCNTKCSSEPNIFVDHTFELDSTDSTMLAENPQSAPDVHSIFFNS
jgi:hypothetical protein